MSEKQKMAPRTEKQKSFKLVDDPSVKELYVNRLVSASFDGGALTVTMGVARILPERTGSKAKSGESPDVHVTARLTLSPVAAAELTKALTNMLSSLSKAANRAEENAAGKPEGAEAN